MKKQFVMMAGLLAFAVSALGQGQVTLGNNSTSLIYAFSGGPPVANGTTLFQLLAGATPDSLTPLLPIVGTSSFPGRIANTVMDITVVAPGETAYFQVRAWSIRFATYQEAVNSQAQFGFSVVFSSMTSRLVVPPDPPVLLAGNYPSFSIFIPEPSTWTLMGLSGLFFLVVSRVRGRKGKTFALR